MRTAPNFRLAVLLALALLLSFGSAQAADYDRLMAQAIQLDEQNRNAEALALLRQAEQLREPDSEHLRLIAKQLSQLMSETPNRQERRNLGRESVDYATRSVEANPNNAMARIGLAICLGRVALYESPRTRMEYSRKLKREAELAAQLDPNIDYAWHVLGRWHYELATLNPAVRAIAQAVYGRLPDASLEQAATYLERAVRTGPPRVVHHVELGRTYLALGRTEEGRRQIERGLSLPNREKDDEETKARGREALASL
jgi:tetratricopeptide (TPR) repeat protein